MSSKAYEYRIVHGSKEVVEVEVQNLTERGWTLHGSHQMFPFNGVVLFSQTLIKEYEQPGAWG